MMLAGKQLFLSRSVSGAGGLPDCDKDKTFDTIAEGLYDAAPVILPARASSSVMRSMCTQWPEWSVNDLKAWFHSLNE